IAAFLTFDDGQLTDSAITHGALSWHTIDAKTKDENTFDKALVDAAREGKPVLIDFYADWCVACRQLELLTFQDETVVKELQAFTLIRVDATQSSDYVENIENRYGVTGLPTIVFVDKQGKTSK